MLLPTVAFPFRPVNLSVRFIAIQDYAISCMLTAIVLRPGGEEVRQRRRSYANKVARMTLSRTLFSTQQLQHIMQCLCASNRSSCSGISIARQAFSISELQYVAHQTWRKMSNEYGLHTSSSDLIGWDLWRRLLASFSFGAPMTIHDTNTERKL